VIELDVSGRKLLVGENDLEWLRVRAEKAAGSSSAASDLAGRLAAVNVNQRRLVFVRSEARALFNALGGASEAAPAGLLALSELLRDTFAR